MDTNNVNVFLSSCIEELSNIEEKVQNLNIILNQVFSEVKAQIPKTESILKKAINLLKEIIEYFDLKKIKTLETNIIKIIHNELNAIIFTFSDISNYLSIHDNINKMSESIIRTIKLSLDLIKEAETFVPEKELLKIISSLKVIQERISMALLKVGDELDCLVNELPEIFSSMISFLTPPSSLKMTTEGEIVKNKISIVKDNIQSLIDAPDTLENVKKELKSLIKDVIPIEDEIEIVNENLNKSKEFIARMNQPYSDISSVNNNILKLSEDAKDVISSLETDGNDDINNEELISELNRILPL